MKKQQKGFTIIELIIVVLIIAIIAVIAIPNFVASRRAANESSAISNLRSLHIANATFQSTSQDRQFATSMTELRDEGLIDNVLGNAETVPKSGYLYRYFRNAPGTSPAVFDFSAEPFSFTGFSATGNRSFVVSEQGVIFFNLTPTAPLVDDTTRIITNGNPLNN